MPLIIPLKLMFVNNTVKLTLSIVFSVVIISLFSSCKVNTNTYVDYSVGVDLTSDYASVQHLNISLANTYFKAIYDTALLNNGEANIDGAIIKYMPDSLYQLKIIYPYWGAEDGYGNRRSGEIHIQANDGFFSVEQNVVFNFRDFNFTKDTIKASLFKVIYSGSNEQNDVFQIITEDESRSMEDSTGVIVFNSVQDFTIKLNESNPTIVDEFLVSGKLNGISRSGSDFQSLVVTELLSDLECNWMKNGIVDLTFDEVSYAGQVFYSDSSVCENWYNLIIDSFDFPSKIQKPKDWN